METNLSNEDKRMLAALGQAIALSLEETTPAVVQHAPLPPEPEDDLPTFVQDFIDLVADGTYDPYLEITLNTLHSRKRRLRNVRGF